MSRQRTQSLFFCSQWDLNAVISRRLAVRVLHWKVPFFFFFFCFFGAYTKSEPGATVPRFWAVSPAARGARAHVRKRAAGLEPREPLAGYSSSCAWAAGATPSAARWMPDGGREAIRFGTVSARPFGLCVPSGAVRAALPKRAPFHAVTEVPPASPELVKSATNLPRTPVAQSAPHRPRGPNRPRLFFLAAVTQRTRSPCKRHRHRLTPVSCCRDGPSSLWLRRRRKVEAPPFTNFPLKFSEEIGLAYRRFAAALHERRHN